MIASLISTAKSFATLSRSFSPHVLQQSKFGCRPRFLKTPGFRAGGGRFPRLSSRASTGNDHVLHKIEKLKLTSATTFRRPEFQNVLWAGVCGSFSRGTETHFSDVDIIVIEEPRLRSEPPSFIYLDDCLLRVWARKVDAHFISLGDSNPYKSLAYSKMHDLIESRTIYIRDQEACSEIARFRDISIEKTAEAHAHYSEITKRIDHLGEKYAAVSIYFLLAKDSSEQEEFLAQVSSIPNLFGVELDYEIMHWLFRLEFQPKVDAMLDLLNSLKEIAEENSQPAFQRSRLVWALHLVQSHDQDGIGYLSRKLKEEILPPLAKTIELGTCMEDIYTQTTFDPEDLVDEANGREVPQVFNSQQ